MPGESWNDQLPGMAQWRSSKPYPKRCIGPVSVRVRERGKLQGAALRIRCCPTTSGRPMGCYSRTASLTACAARSGVLAPSGVPQPSHRAWSDRAEIEAVIQRFEGPEGIVPPGEYLIGVGAK